MIRSNFTAELHCQYGRVGVVDTPISAHPIFSADQDGWLCTDDKRGESVSFKPIRFRFEFVRHETAPDRHFYYITCVDSWEFSGAKLDSNSNGWVGLYGTYILGRLNEELNPFYWIPVIWKIQCLQEWDGDIESAPDIEFYLRDRNGYRIAHAEAIYERNHPRLRHWFLNAGPNEGEILKFHLHEIKLE